MHSNQQTLSISLVRDMVDEVESWTTGREYKQLHEVRFCVRLLVRCSVRLLSCSFAFCVRLLSVFVCFLCCFLSVFFAFCVCLLSVCVCFLCSFAFCVRLLSVLFAFCVRLLSVWLLVRLLSF